MGAECGRLHVCVRLMQTQVCGCVCSELILDEVLNFVAPEATPMDMWVVDRALLMCAVVWPSSELSCKGLFCTVRLCFRIYMKLFPRSPTICIVLSSGGSFPQNLGGTAPLVRIYGFASCRVHVGRIPEFSKRGQSGCVGGSPPVGSRSKSQIIG